MIKNNKYLLMLVAAYILMFSIAVTAQPKTFQKTYGSAVNEVGNFVQRTLDGGYIMCGAKGVPGTIGYYDFYLTKIDAFGNVEWTKSIGDSIHDEQAYCIRQLSDGSYIVYGTHSGSTSSTAWLIKTDAQGNTLWSKEQQGSQSARYGYSLVIAPDGGFQTASFDNGTGNSDYFQLQKTQSSGTIQWGPKNVVQGIGTSSSLAVTKDNNYIAVGTTDIAYDPVTKNYLSAITLVKMNDAGTVLWSKMYKVNSGTSSYNYLQGFGVQATDDGGYIICGSTNVNSNGGTDILLLKAGSNGDSLWSRNYGGAANDVALSVKEVPEGGYIVSGSTRSYGKGSADVFMLRATASGDSMWMHTFGGTGLEAPGNIEVMEDGGFVMIGTTNSFGAGQGDLLLIRTDNLGRVPDAGISTSGSVSICTGSSVTLTALAGYTYQWSNGATTQSITVGQAGDYSVSITDNFSNVNISEKITVVINTPLTSCTLTAYGSTAFCAGSSVALIADSLPGCVYQWQANSMDIPGARSRKFIATEEASYNAVVRNACNAVKTYIIEVSVQLPPDEPTITWMGNTLVSSSSSNNQWYKDGSKIEGAVHSTYTPLQSGYYVVVAGDVNYCTAASQPYYYGTVSIDEAGKSASYTLYPNPAENIVYIDYSLQSLVSGYFVIYSLEGKEAYREKLLNESGMLKINIEGLSSGFYLSGIETQNVFTGKKSFTVARR